MVRAPSPFDPHAVSSLRFERRSFSLEAKRRAANARLLAALRSANDRWGQKLRPLANV